MIPSGAAETSASNGGFFFITTPGVSPGNLLLTHGSSSALNSLASASSPMTSGGLYQASYVSSTSDVKVAARLTHKTVSKLFFCPSLFCYLSSSDLLL